MIVHKILDSVFATWSNIAVLRVIAKVKIGLSGREIAKQAGMSASSCLETLTSLENLNLVTRQRGGREHFFYLNREHYIVKKVVIPNLNFEKKFPEVIYSDIKNELGEHSISLIIFGSTARAEERIESDLDICAVFTNAINKRRMENSMTTLNSLLFKKYGISVSPFYISEKEFRNRAKMKKEPVVDIVKEGKTISGKTIRELVHVKKDNKKTSR